MRFLPMLTTLVTLAALPAAAQRFTISEENPPASCPSPLIAQSFHCEGDFCDNITVRCGLLDGDVGFTEWTHWVESDGRVRADCNDPHDNGSNFNRSVMTGLACRGGNCDDVSVQCTSMRNFVRDDANCVDIVHTDGDRAITIPSGAAIRALSCEGRHCDNVTVTICQMLPAG